MNLPPTIVITMPQRWDRVAAHLNAMNVPHMIFPAFDGRKLGVKTEYPYLEDHGGPQSDFWKTTPPYFVSQGILGLCLSAFAVVKMAMAMGWSEVLVLEDDVVLCDDFHERYAELRRDLPHDYGMCYLGWCCFDEGRRGRVVGPNLMEGKCLCTHAVLMNRNALEVIERESVLWSEVDIFYFFKVFPHVKTYVCYPNPLATQLSASVCPSLIGRQKV